MYDSDALINLKELHDSANGALGAAEDLGWVVALLFAMLVYDRWHMWAVALGAGLLGYVFATYRYRKAEGKAEDAYYGAASLGRYYIPPKE